MPINVARANGRRCSAIRAPIKHIFAYQKDKMRLFIRTIGLARARTKIGLANLVYNMKRLTWLCAHRRSRLRGQVVDLTSPIPDRLRRRRHRTVNATNTDEPLPERNSRRRSCEVSSCWPSRCWMLRRCARCSQTSLWRPGSHLRPLPTGPAWTTTRSASAYDRGQQRGRVTGRVTGIIRKLFDYDGQIVTSFSVLPVSYWLLGAFS